jgi:hypothetical protein
MRNGEDNSGRNLDARILSGVKSRLLNTLIQAQAEFEEAPAERRRAARDRYVRVLCEFCDAQIG